MGFLKITFKIEFSPNSALICDYYGGRGANEQALALYLRILLKPFEELFEEYFEELFEELFEEHLKDLLMKFF